MPNLPENKKRDLVNRCLDNIGMTMFELLAPKEFKLAGQKANVIGPGKVLSGLVKRINRDVKIDTINNQGDIENLQL